MNLRSRLNKLEQNAKDELRCQECNDGKLPVVVRIPYGESSRQIEPNEANYRIIDDLCVAAAPAVISILC